MIHTLSTHHAELIARTSADDYFSNPSALIAQTARVCRNGTADAPKDIEAARELCIKLLSWGHETPFEFIDLTFYCVTNRAVSHELVRHRMASYMQESQRYCDYKEHLYVIPPAAIMTNAPGEPPLSRHDTWFAGVSAAYSAYCSLLDMGVSPEDARTVLPTCTATAIMVKMNLREFRHFLNLRTAPPAWSEMRTLANAMADAFERAYPSDAYLIADVRHQEHDHGRQ